MNPYLHFFCGGDLAPSEGQNSDDSAVVCAAAHPKLWTPGDTEFVMSPRWEDWTFRYCYARRLTAKERASGRQMSGMLHDLHRRFQFSRMVMDPNGGGVNVAREMIEPKQIIGGTEVECRPIGDVVRAPSLVADADFILHLWKRPLPKEPDQAIMDLWPGLAGDDVLNQVLYSQLKTALDLGGECIEFPPSAATMFGTRAEEVRAWADEQVWALKNLDAMTSQMHGVFTKMKPDGETYETTARGAKVFDATGKKDLVSAAMYCWIAFLLFLQIGEFEQPGETPAGEGSFQAW